MEEPLYKGERCVWLADASMVSGLTWCRHMQRINIHSLNKGMKEGIGIMLNNDLESTV